MDSLFAVAEANMAAEYAVASDLETRHSKCHRSMRACALMKAWDEKRRPKPSDFSHACLHCMIAKITANAYRSKGRHAAHANGDRVSADCSTNWPISVNGFKHMLLIVDWYSNKFFMFLLRTKKEAPHYLAYWLRYACSHLGHPANYLHID